MGYVAGYLNDLFSRNVDEKKVPDREGVVISSLGQLPESVESVDVLPTVLELLELEVDGLNGEKLME
jgi:hypothetical protein